MFYRFVLALVVAMAMGFAVTDSQFDNPTTAGAVSAAYVVSHGRTTRTPKAYDGTKAEGSKGYLTLAALSDADLSKLYDTVGGRSTSTIAVRVGHALPTTHNEACDIAQKALRAKFGAAGVAGTYSAGTIWHSSPKSTARRITSKARYDANALTTHGAENDLLMACAGEHASNGYKRSKCTVECVQGLLAYTVGNGEPTYTGGKWLYESTFGRQAKAAGSKPAVKGATAAPKQRKRGKAADTTAAVEKPATDANEATTKAERDLAHANAASANVGATATASTAAPKVGD